MLEYTALLRALQGPMPLGLAAAVYTQTADVERETNGLITYDREVVKLDPAVVGQLHAALYMPMPPATYLLPPAKTRVPDWRYTVTEPEEGWAAPGYDDSAWEAGPGPITSRAAFRQVPKGTPWGSDEVWLRTTFASADGLSLERLWLESMTDFATVTVYLNGQFLAQLDNPLKSPQNYRHVGVRCNAIGG